MKASRGVLIVALALLAIAALRDLRAPRRCASVASALRLRRFLLRGFGPRPRRGSVPLRTAPQRASTQSTPATRLSRRSAPRRSGAASAVRFSALHARGTPELSAARVIDASQSCSRSGRVDIGARSGNAPLDVAAFALLFPAGLRAARRRAGRPVRVRRSRLLRRRARARRMIGSPASSPR